MSYFRLTVKNYLISVNMEDTSFGWFLILGI